MEFRGPDEPVDAQRVDAIVDSARELLTGTSPRCLVAVRDSFPFHQKSRPCGPGCPLWIIRRIEGGHAA
jgi:hypothetical protein